MAQEHKAQAGMGHGVRHTQGRHGLGLDQVGGAAHGVWGQGLLEHQGYDQKFGSDCVSGGSRCREQIEQVFLLLGSVRLFLRYLAKGRKEAALTALFTLVPQVRGRARSSSVMLFAALTCSVSH